jgi:NADPH:quinone reductase-like Zn-dependent oxidoreductase
MSRKAAKWQARPPGRGEVRIRISAPGINPGDTQKSSDTFGVGMPYPRLIPYSGGAGRIDQIGPGVGPEWIGRAVWCYGAQSYRAFGTVAEFTVVPVDHVAPLPANVSMEHICSVPFSDVLLSWNPKLIRFFPNPDLKLYCSGSIARPALGSDRN